MLRIILLLVTLGCAATSVWAELPVVRTQVRIEAETFVNGLAGERGRVEAEVAGILASELDRYYKFLTWSADPAGEADRSAHAAELELRLFAERKPLGVAIFLEYAPRVGDEVYAPPDRAEELYEEFEEQPKDKPDLLIDDLKETIIQRLRDDSFRSKLEEGFLSKIPLTTEVEADEQMKVILIPLSLEELRATEASELAAEFEARNDSNVFQNGSLHLDPSGGREDRPGWVQCSVRKFHFPPEDETSWHPKIPEVLRGELLKSITVYMALYDMESGQAGAGGRLADTLREDDE